MLATHLEADILTRKGRDLLPSSFPIEELILLARQLTLFTDGLMSQDEVAELGRFLRAYVKRLLSSQGDGRLREFENNSAALFPTLAHELNELIRDELVSRLIGHKAATVNLSDLFEKHFSKS
jgi:hypothetical protein